MEFLRFGSSIPGSYWGCCACDIIQNFKVDPDAKASIEIVTGDGNATTGKFVGKTWREIFKARLRFGTFDSRDMPNHAFLAILTINQINGTYGKAWLAILKEHGFEFIRAVDNSVYSGGGNTNYIFGLFRNISGNRLKDPFTPPQAWADLPSVKSEAWELGSPEAFVGLAKTQTEQDKAIFDALGRPNFYTEAALEKEGIPIWYAGVRNKYPQQQKSARDALKALEAKKEAKPAAAIAEVFGEQAA